MNMKAPVRVSLALLCLVALPLPAMAGLNVSQPLAYPMQAGQRITETVAASTEAWFQYRLTGGHSYCVEVDNSANMASSFSGFDTRIALYDSNGTTPLGFNNNIDSGMEPRAVWGSRICFIDASVAATSHDVFVRVYIVNGWPGTFDLRLVETTLFGSLLYTYGDFNGSIQIRNTTSASLDFKLTFRNSAGVVIATPPAVSLAGNASVNLAAKTYVGANVLGSIEIAHTGSSEAIAANVTSLSMSTGLSFDNPFIKRQPW